jgi:hypothetical protein
LRKRFNEMIYERILKLVKVLKIPNYKFLCHRTIKYKGPSVHSKFDSKDLPRRFTRGSSNL